MREKYYYETASAGMLEFEKIIQKLEESVYSEGAKEKVRNLAPMLKETEVKARLKERLKLLKI